MSILPKGRGFSGHCAKYCRAAALAFLWIASLARAEAYLKLLNSRAGQEIAAKHSLRPRSAEVVASHAAAFAKLDLFTVEEVAGGWEQAQKTHFSDGGIFDQIQIK